jgi:hypothetical protein
LLRAGLQGKARKPEVRSIRVRTCTEKPENAPKTNESICTATVIRFHKKKYSSTIEIVLKSFNFCHHQNPLQIEPRAKLNTSNIKPSDENPE